jgi:hypothetical protein
VAEQTGNIDIIEVNSSGEQIIQEIQLNHMSVIPNESDTDTGYTADHFQTKAAYHAKLNQVQALH